VTAVLTQHPRALSPMIVAGIAAGLASLIAFAVWLAR
jgi:hypothetical protein